MPRYEPTEYLLAEDEDGLPSVVCQRAKQRDGSVRWKVRSGPVVLSKDGTWQYEPRPSSRTDDFLAWCRFDSLDEAIAAWEALPK